MTAARIQASPPNPICGRARTAFATSPTIRGVVMRKRFALTSFLVVALAVAVAVPLVAMAGSHRAAQTASVKLKEFAFVSAQLQKPTFGKPSNLRAGSTTSSFDNLGK